MSAQHWPDSGFPEPERDPLDQERAGVLRALGELEGEAELAARAELAHELVALSAVLLDAENRALVDFLAAHGREPELAALEAAVERVRKAMEPVHEALRRSTPIEVHQAQPQAFEADLTALVASIREYLDLERQELGAVRGSLPPEVRLELDAELGAGRASAIAAVRPPRRGLGRLRARFGVWLEHPDAGTAYRPVETRRRGRNR